jgi:hypothetical protein
MEKVDYADQLSLEWQREMVITISSMRERKISIKNISLRRYVQCSL